MGKTVARSVQVPAKRFGKPPERLVGTGILLAVIIVFTVVMGSLTGKILAPFLGKPASELCPGKTEGDCPLPSDRKTP